MQIVIIGNGVAGATAAISITNQLQNASILMISNEKEYFFSRPAMMYMYLGSLKEEHTLPYPREFWDNHKIKRLKTQIVEICTKDKYITTNNSEHIQYDKLIIATGSKTKYYGWKGQNHDRVTGFYHFRDLEALEKNDKIIKNVVIIGGGLIGIELAEMLLSRHKNVTLIIKGNKYWDNKLFAEEANIISDHIATMGVNCMYNTQVVEIVHRNKEILEGVKINKLNEELIPADWVCVATGVSPNIDFVKGSGINIDIGILVDQYCSTNDPDVYAVGDCAQNTLPIPLRNPIEPIWYTAKQMGETVGLNILNKEKIYNPGIWYNSAKFFHIEYLEYGHQPNILAENQSTLAWKSKTGYMYFRLIFDKESRALVGIRSLKVRLNHKTCIKWLTDKVTISEAVKNLSKICGNDEFSKCMPEITKVFTNNLKNELIWMS